MANEHLDPIVRTWFERRFGTPTEAQARGWPAIASGRHTLIAAPTGSGKTLAAFLISLDGLVRQALSDDGLPNATQVVYVSPLKALANDIQRNLIEPLEEITALAEQQGTPLPEREWAQGNVLPDRITIYQQPIVEDSDDDDAIIRTIGETVIHEFGHYFGLSEEEIEEIESRYWRGETDPDDR